MRYSIATEDEAVVLHLADRLTFVDSEPFKAALAALEQSGKRTYVVDLKDLEFIDSFGLGLLVLLYDHSEKQRARLILRHASGMVRERLDYTRFETIAAVED